jgi:Icc-related predicted phosphoesterase
MTFAFDLISDLHVETWPTKFTWEDQATSPYCVIGGDIARDREVVVNTLRHLGQCYQAVFYIDGNDEHVHYYEDLAESYRDLTCRLENIPNVVYLQNNVVVIDGVAIVGTNGWFGYDFDPYIDPIQTALWFQDKTKVSDDTVKTVNLLANTDATYMINTVDRLQTHLDVKKIVMITHTVPRLDLISHDIALSGSLRLNTMGNSYMMDTLVVDHGNKIDTWCFGHYHGSVNQIRNGVRYVNNCQGRGGTPYSQCVYHPQRIEIKI